MTARLAQWLRELSTLRDSGLITASNEYSHGLQIFVPGLIRTCQMIGTFIYLEQRYIKHIIMDIIDSYPKYLQKSWINQKRMPVAVKVTEIINFR